MMGNLYVNKTTLIDKKIKDTTTEIMEYNGTTNRTAGVLNAS